MPPLVRPFSPADLPTEIQRDAAGRQRKTPGGRPVDLERCELFSLTQYKCRVEEPHRPEGRVICDAVDRWFRR